jgi:hypothetical protein
MTKEEEHLTTAEAPLSKNSKTSEKESTDNQADVVPGSEGGDLMFEGSVETAACDFLINDPSKHEGLLRQLLGQAPPHRNQGNKTAQDWSLSEKQVTQRRRRTITAVECK